MRKNLLQTLSVKAKQAIIYNTFGHLALSTINGTFSIRTLSEFTLCSALQSHLKEVLISNVSPLLRSH